MTSSLPPPPSSPIPPPTPPLGEVHPHARRWLWIGIALAVLGALAAIAWFVWHFVQLNRAVGDFHRASRGQAAELIVDQSVSWTVFIEPADRSLTGVRYRIRSTATGEDAALGNYAGSFTYGVPEGDGRSIATVRLEPGTYLLSVEQGDAVIAVGPSPARFVRWMLVGGFLIGIPAVGGGAALAVVNGLRLTRGHNRRDEPPERSAWSSGEWPDSSGG